MKHTFIIGFWMAAVLTAKAQFLSSEAFGGAALGGLAGGIIGHNNGNHTAEGIGIGAGAGLLLGAIVHNEREDRYYRTPGPYYGYSRTYYGPGYGYSTTYYAPSRPNYAITGAAMGGVAGGIIGHNQHGHTLEGVAIGAGAGLVLGAVAEQHARPRVRVQYVQASGYYVMPTTVMAAPATAAPVDSQAIAPAVAAAPVVTTPTPLGSANGLFGR
jgi:uncharacterized protein YcfJ